LAEAVQERAMQIGTHVHLGQWYQPAAVRKGVLDGILKSPAPVFWNVTKKGS
jgi:peptide/nickel transport system substrate-binding protein